MERELKDYYLSKIMFMAIIFSSNVVFNIVEINRHCAFHCAFPEQFISFSRAVYFLEG